MELKTSKTKMEENLQCRLTKSKSAFMDSYQRYHLLLSWHGLKCALSRDDGVWKKFLGCYQFKSKTHQDECSPEGLCKAAVFAMLVEEELESWPEQNTRSRKWLTVSEAADSCRHPWMRDALIGGFCKWHAENMLTKEIVAD